jgi:hypothetical protein
MAIPLCGTFEYEAKFTKEGFSDSEIVLHGTDLSGLNADRLVGLNPMIRFWNEHLVLVATGKPKSTMRTVSIPIGDAVNLSARTDDQLYLIRTASGGIGLSVLRQQRLILAIGAVTAVPLGKNMRVTIGPEGGDVWENPSADTWLEFGVQSETLKLREREEREAGGYYIYVERCWEYGIPGTDECVSVCFMDNSAMKIAAIRSAVMLANCGMKGGGWDLSKPLTEL